MLLKTSQNKLLALSFFKNHMTSNDSDEYQSHSTDSSCSVSSLESEQRFSLGHIEYCIKQVYNMVSVYIISSSKSNHIL